MGRNGIVAASCPVKPDRQDSHLAEDELLRLLHLRARVEATFFWDYYMAEGNDEYI